MIPVYHLVSSHSYMPLSRRTMSSRHIVQCLFPGSAGLQPGLEATLERGVPRGMHKNSCGDALASAGEMAPSFFRTS